MTAIPSNVDLKDKQPEAVWAAPKVLAKKLTAPTEACQVLSRSLKFLSFFGIIIGIDARYDWKCDSRFTFTKNLTGFVWLQIFYTQILYVYQHDVVRIWEVFAIYGIAMSAILKIHCYEKYYENIAALFESTVKISQQNTGRRGDRLVMRLNENFTFYKFIASLAIFIIVIYVFYPVKSFLVDGLLVPFVPIELMFLDQTRLLGYFIASTIMATSGIYAVMGTEYMGLVFVYLIANFSPRVDILEIDIDELDQLWEDTSTSTLAYRHMFIRNMCRKYLDMRHYVAEIKEIFDQKMFIFFVFAYLSQILCMYQIRVNDWIPGYALAIGFFMEMIFYCVMGTKLNVENDRLFYIITQSKWYTYDLSSQRMMLLLMNLAINSDELSIGSLKPLSVYTATEIVKSIYTYYTVMMEVM